MFVKGKVKKLLLKIGIILLLIGGVFFGWRMGWWKVETEFKNPTGSTSLKLRQTEKNKKIEKNTGYLAQYNFENLKIRENKSSKIEIVEESKILDEARKNLIKAYAKEGIKKESNFVSKVITFTSNGKKISGMMNVPLTPKSNKMPAVIIIRGFAEAEGYFVGSGSWKMADELARNGFVTISLDFLGFGKSSQESTDILEARFEKPVSVLDLIESVKNLDFVDTEKIGIWAHSNGGQIAISILEITGINYPTVLWAPMTKPFPESVLETMDDSENGKIVKQKIADFEKKYDSKLYSIDNFYNDIQAPILIHQGTADEWCKVSWQKDLQNKLKKMDKEVILDIREDNDHNLKQSWDEVAKMDVEFFNEKLGIL